MENTATKPNRYFLKTRSDSFGSETRSFRDLKSLRDEYVRLREQSNEGASTFHEGKILQERADGSLEQTHRISYNGRVWLGTEWKLGETSISVDA